MGVAGCYDLALACDGADCAKRHRMSGKGHQYTPLTANYNHEQGASCRRMARKAGWKFDEVEGWAYCRLCVAEAPKTKSR